MAVRYLLKRISSLTYGLRELVMFSIRARDGAYGIRSVFTEVAAWSFLGEFDLLRCLFGKAIVYIVMCIGSVCWKPPPRWNPMVVCLGTRAPLMGWIG